MRRLWMTILVGCSLLIVQLAGGGVAYGQTSTTEGSTTTTTGVDLSSGRITVAVVALGAGLLLVLAVLVFLFNDRARTADMVSRLGRSGVSIKVQSAGAVVGDLLGGEPPIVVSGVSPIEVGTPCEFTATAAGGPITVTWSSSDEGVSGGVAATSPTVALVPVKPGRFTLIARADQHPEGRLEVVVVPPMQGRAVEVSYLGSGWGTVVIALAVASVTAALGVTGVISGETVGVILGAIVGYGAAQGVGRGSQRNSGTEGNGGA